MSELTEQKEKLKYQQKVNELGKTLKTSTAGQTRTAQNTQNTNRTQTGDTSSTQTTNRTQTGEATDNNESTGLTKGVENGQSDGTTRQESETTRALTSRSVGKVQKSDRVNIGCQVTFTVKIRGGMPLTAQTKNC